MRCNLRQVARRAAALAMALERLEFVDGVVLATADRHGLRQLAVEAFALAGESAHPVESASALTAGESAHPVESASALTAGLPSFLRPPADHHETCECIECVGYRGF